MELLHDIYCLSEVKWSGDIAVDMWSKRPGNIWQKKFVWFSDGEFEQWGKRITRKDQNVELKTKDLELFMWQLFSIHITNVSSWRSKCISVSHLCWNLLGFFSVSQHCVLQTLQFRTEFKCTLWTRKTPFFSWNTSVYEQ